MTSSHQEDQQNEDWTQEAEDSLEELELKRKLDDQVVHAGRKPKRLRMERLEGWVVCTSPEEGVRDGRDDQLVVKDDGSDNAPIGHAEEETNKHPREDRKESQSG